MGRYEWIHKNQVVKLDGDEHKVYYNLEYLRPQFKEKLDSLTEKCQNEKQVLFEKIEKCKSQFRHQQDAFQRQQKMVSQYETDNLQDEKKYEESKTLLKDLQLKLQQKSNEIENYKEKMKHVVVIAEKNNKKKQIINELKNQIQKLMSENQHYEEILRKNATKNEKANSQQIDWKSYYEDAIKTYNEYKAMCDRYRQQNKELRSHKEQIKHNLGEFSRQQQYKNRQLQESIGKKNEELAKLKNLQSQLESLDIRKNVVEKVKKIQQDYKILEEKNKQCEEKIAYYERRKNEYKMLVKKLASENQRLLQETKSSKSKSGFSFFS